MGWNSWNTFKCDGINEIVIKEMADTMISKGLKEQPFGMNFGLAGRVKIKQI